MEINSQVNTFIAGMNLDSDITMVPDKQYRWAQNVRLLTDDAGTTGILQNIEDIRQYMGGLELSETILGTAVSRWYNINKDKVEECGVVFTKELYESNRINNLWIVTDFNSISPTWTLVVSAILNITDKVSIVTNFESNNVSKVYISDGNTSIKCINIQKNYQPSKSAPIEDSTFFDLLPSSTMLPFQFKNYVSGNLMSGTVQYCYQLFNVHGEETTTSPLSEMIPITSFDVNNSKFAKGNNSNEPTDKGCSLSTILFNNTKFEKMRVIRIQYDSYSQNPKIYIINEIDLPNSDSESITITYDDTGTNEINQLSVEEFNNLVPFEFKAKSIAKMNNRLFASNLQEITWDVAYDARAYRCDKNGRIKLESSIDNKSMSLTVQQLLDTSNDIIIPEDHDCINPMNGQLTYPNEDETEYAFGYEDTYSVRGGIGVNIKYRFVIADLIESDSAPTVDSQGRKMVKYDLDLSSSKKNNSVVKLFCPETKQELYAFDTDGQSRIRNYSDPYYVSNFLGYQRDETYRFGIVFYNNKNIPSPVHWIGDIRFPSADVVGYEPFSFASTVDGQGEYELVSHPLGILFEVDNLPLEVVSYEIVRCARQKSDRTVVSQGLLNKTLRFNGYHGNTDNYEPQWSLGSSDRRPTIVPTFAKSVIFPVAQGVWQYELSTPRLAQQDNQAVNPFDTNGVFTLVSPEVSFNKEKADQIIKSNMKIVPLMCVNGASIHRGEKKYGVPFTGIIGGKSTDLRSNPFGGIISSTTIHSGQTSLEDGIFDGFEQGSGDLSGGLCKLYQFFSKSYANQDTSAKRVAFNINDITKTTNITPYTAKFEDSKAYIDYIGGYSFVNFAPGSYVSYGVGGVNMALYAPDVYSGGYTGIDRTPFGSDYKWASALIVNIKTPAAQYGGNTFVNRSYSSYCSTSTFVTKRPTNGYDTALCFGGDTYLGVFDYSHSLLGTTNEANIGNGYKRFVQCYIPVESSVNLYYRADEHFSQTATKEVTTTTTGIANPYYLTEPGTLSTLYSQKTPMYVYNAAYSANNTSKQYIQKSMYAEDDVKSMNRITCSEVKSINEQTDSWTKFKFANYLDTDSTYGPITNLKIFKNKLYFFQDSAVGIASVNDRSLINDNNAGELVLGTGGILTRYDYLITQNGSSIINDKSITNSETTLYWHDFDKNVLCALGSDFHELSKVKQVQTYLNRLPDTARENPVSFYDKKYNEVWFRIYDRCLIFNEQLNVFTSFYTHNPNWFFPFSNRLVTIKNNNCYYLHNMYYVEDSQKKEERISYIRFVINKDIAYTKVFDNQWFSAEFEDVGDEERPTLITDIHFETKTQVTEPIDYNNIDIREDNYRFAISREKQKNPELQQQTNMSYAGRMRGKYLICNYTFDCNDNKEFKLPYIKTTYRYSML